MRAELLDRQAVGTVVHAIAIRQALEAAGIELGEAGVKLKKAEVSAFCSLIPWFARVNFGTLLSDRLR